MPGAAATTARVTRGQVEAACFSLARLHLAWAAAGSFQNAFGSSSEVRRSASPISYVAPGAPPFLILQGSEDPMVRPRQSIKLAQRLHTAGVPTTLIEVDSTDAVRLQA